MNPDHLANLSTVLHRWSAGEQASPDVMADVHAAQAARVVRKATPHNAAGNIAVLNLWGVMAQKANLVDEASGGGGTSTQAFMAAFRESMANPSVAAILIDCDSPGGSVTGTPELAAEVMKARGVKPVYAFVNGLAASACYWVASACEAIYSTPSGSTGSIGVYCAHTDASKAMEKAGLAQEFISAGKFKTEDNSNGPLNPDARAFIQSQIDTYYAMFTGDVARGRGTTPAAVRNGFGQGRCLLADDALRAGLVDGVCSFEQVVSKLSARVKGTAGAAPGQGRSGAAGSATTISANAQKRERELAVLAGGAQDNDAIKRRAAQRLRAIQLAEL